jgi:hypothetical protein
MRILNKDESNEFLDIGNLPIGGTLLPANWRMIFTMLKNKYPEVKEITLTNKEFSAFVRGLSVELILENLNEIKHMGVKVIKENTFYDN